MSTTTSIPHQTLHLPQLSSSTPKFATPHCSTVLSATTLASSTSPSSPSSMTKVVKDNKDDEMDIDKAQLESYLIDLGDQDFPMDVTCFPAPPIESTISQVGDTYVTIRGKRRDTRKWADDDMKWSWVDRQEYWFHPGNFECQKTRRKILEDHEKGENMVWPDDDDMVHTESIKKKVRIKTNTPKLYVDEAVLSTTPQSTSSSSSSSSSISTSTFSTTAPPKASLEDKIKVPTTNISVLQ